jgi:hypothetical protein
MSRRVAIENLSQGRCLLASTDAIAFLGDTIVALLQDGLSGIVTPADVLLSTPDQFKDFQPLAPSVTIFLYHVRINAEMRNGPPRVLPNGSLRRPPLPLELRFLVTPWTQDTRDAYRIIGAIAQVFYDRAKLGFGDLLGVNVWDIDDTVELVLESLPVDEHFSIWEPADIPYKLSLSYLARLVGIESTIVKSAAPVAVATVQGGP